MFTYKQIKDTNKPKSEDKLNWVTYYHTKIEDRGPTDYSISEIHK